ncbi:MAG: hypothetical protein NTZ83_03285, partial [Candidatus Pacearchaeota archaeon]|nr:hypothetical protein [Candidatus Pacearchaeota archaeon]
KAKNQEALELSEEILRNFELSQIPIQQILLKCLRLARLINDFEAFEWLKFEANGFETTSDGLLTPQAWQAASKSGRVSHKTEKELPKGKKPGEYANTETIGVMEEVIEISKKRMEVAYDPNISVSSQSTYYPVLPPGNAEERNTLSNIISERTKVIEKVRARIYEYILNVNYEFKFGKITEEIFTKRRNYVDRVLKDVCPKAVQKFISAYENLESGNDEDWANAVHSCRRILKEVADKLNPPDSQPVIGKNGKSIEVGEDKYINRLVLHAESKSSSEKFNAIVGSHLKFLGERLDSVNEAANKGTHCEVTLEEAERYIIYTYLLLGDILSLDTKQESSENISNNTK